MTNNFICNIITSCIINKTMIKTIFFIPVVTYFSLKMVNLMRLILKINLGQIILILLISIFCFYQIKNYNLKTKFSDIQIPFQKEKTVLIKNLISLRGWKLNFIKMKIYIRMLLSLNKDLLNVFHHFQIFQNMVVIMK